MNNTINWSDIIQSIGVILSIAGSTFVYVRTESKAKKDKSEEEKEKMLKRVILDDIRSYKKKFDDLKAIQDRQLDIAILREETYVRFNILRSDLKLCKIFDEKYSTDLYSFLFNMVAEMETDVMNKHAVNFSEHYYSLVKKVINI